jgi:hypothetical protein
MDREMLERHLRQAEKHVGASARRVVRQREMVAQLEQEGLDTSTARAFLEQLEDMKQRYIADCDRLRRELGK